MVIMGLHADTLVKLDVMEHVIMSVDHVIVFQGILAAGVRTVRLVLTFAILYSTYLIYYSNITNF